ncbi:MAG: metal ABC transporter permease [Fusobacteriota bacterium]
MFEILQYGFFQHALIAALLATIACGIIGTYITHRNMIFISGGITHASFGGIGIGYFFGINPIISAAVFSILSSIGIEYISEKIKVTRDSMIGIFWSFGMAIGIIFIALSKGYTPNLMTFLFGNILTVSKFDIYLMVGVNSLIILTFLLLYKEILFLSFDETFIKTRRIPTKFLNYFLISLVALTIVINIKIVGIILVISFLTIPQAIASLFVKKYSNIIFFSITVGFLGALIGLFSSYYLNLPSGASIIVSFILIFIISKIFCIINTKINHK